MASSLFSPSLLLLFSMLWGQSTGAEGAEVVSSRSSPPTTAELAILAQQIAVIAGIAAITGAPLTVQGVFCSQRSSEQIKEVSEGHTSHGLGSIARG